MSLRFRRSVRLAPGVRLDLGLRGPSLSVGPRGIGVTVGPAGVTTHAGIPGSGLSYRTSAPLSGASQALPAAALPPGSQAVGADQYKVGVALDLDANGRLTVAAADGSPLDPRVERKIREDHRDRLEAWLASKCAEINAEFDQLLTIHCGTSRPDSDHRLPAEPFAAPRPAEPELGGRSAWDRVFPWRKRARDEQFDRVSCGIDTIWHSGSRPARLMSASGRAEGAGPRSTSGLPLR